MDNLIIKELTIDTWSDFEMLFEGKGGPKNCWCMLWRKSEKPNSEMTKSEKKRCMYDRVSKGIKNGLIGYIENKPVAWCSIAPKNTYKKLTGKFDTSDENVWSLVCFYIQSQYRKSGFQKLLIQSAIDYSILNGACKIEAYPVERESPSYKFMGYLDVFEKNGFTYVGDAGNRRKIYEKIVT